MTSSPSFPVIIPHATVSQLLDWQLSYAAIEGAMVSASEGRAVQNARDVTPLPGTQNLLFTMPGFLEDDKWGALACKIVTHFPGNESGYDLPSSMASILLFDERTGALKALIDGTEITAHRTAVASAVATRHLLRNKPPEQTLAILGAGVQGRIHAIAFEHFFNFKEIRIWNRTSSKAREVCEELKGKNGGAFVVCGSVEECVRDADVVVTATGADVVILKKEWVKEGAHINAIGVQFNKWTELELDIYKSADVYVDSLKGAKSELALLEKAGVQFRGEIGGLITGKVELPAKGRTTVFQSLGMAVEDCAMARIIFDRWEAVNASS